MCMQRIPTRSCTGSISKIDTINVHWPKMATFENEIGDIGVGLPLCQLSVYATSCRLFHLGPLRSTLSWCVSPFHFFVLWHPMPPAFRRFLYSYRSRGQPHFRIMLLVCIRVRSTCYDSNFETYYVALPLSNYNDGHLLCLRRVPVLGIFNYCSLFLFD